MNGQRLLCACIAAVMWAAAPDVVVAAPFQCDVDPDVKPPGLPLALCIHLQQQKSHPNAHANPVAFDHAAQPAWARESKPGAPITPQEAVGPVLSLWITGPATAARGEEITLQVNFHNTGSGLGNLKYDLEFTHALVATDLVVTDREYTDYGWTADPTYDNSDPVDNDTAPGSLLGLHFDTAHHPVNPASTEFPDGTTGFAEVFKVMIPADEPLGLLDFKLKNILATDKDGASWTVASPDGLGGQILPTDWSVEVVPEPASLWLLAVGALALSTRRKSRTTA